MARQEWRRPGTADAPLVALQLLQEIVLERTDPGPWLVRLQSLGGSVHGFRVLTSGAVEVFTTTTFEQVHPPRTLTLPGSGARPPWKPPATWRVKRTTPSPVDGSAEIFKSPAGAGPTQRPAGDGAAGSSAVDLSTIFTAAAATASFAESASFQPEVTESEKEEIP